MLESKQKGTPMVLIKEPLTTTVAQGRLPSQETALGEDISPSIRKASSLGKKATSQETHI